MSRISRKVQLQRDLHCFFLIQDVTASLQNESNEALNYLILIEELKEQRYFSSRLFVLKFNWASIVLLVLSENWFRDLVRMNHFFFSHVVDLIQKDVIFFNKSHTFHTFVKNQLKYALYRMRHDDNESDFLLTVILWEVFEEHVFDCTKRVIKTLCRLKNVFV
jgi:hypothetical protein